MREDSEMFDQDSAMSDGEVLDPDHATTATGLELRSNSIFETKRIDETDSLHHPGKPSSKFPSSLDRNSQIPYNGLGGYNHHTTPDGRDAIPLHHIQMLLSRNPSHLAQLHPNLDAGQLQAPEFREDIETALREMDLDSAVEYGRMEGLKEGEERLSEEKKTHANEMSNAQSVLLAEKQARIESDKELTKLRAQLQSSTQDPAEQEDPWAKILSGGGRQMIVPTRTRIPDN